MNHRRACVVLSGQILDDLCAKAYLDSSAVVICADGGARHCRRLGVVPDLLVGDLDSIDPDDLAWILQQQVPIQRYPAVKDQTDSELAIAVALAHLDERQAKMTETGPHDVVLLASLGGRPDHVLANQLLAVRLVASGHNLRLSDGQSHLIALSGRTSVGVQLSRLPANSQARTWAVSVIPISDQVTGLSYTGLQYPLDQASLELGSCQGVSNRPLVMPAEDDPSVPAVPSIEPLASMALTQKPPALTIRLASGSVLIIITPEV